MEPKPLVADEDVLSIGLGNALRTQAVSRGLDVNEELRRQAAYVAEIGEWPALGGPGDKEGGGARVGRAGAGGLDGLEQARGEGPGHLGSEQEEEAAHLGAEEEEGAELETVQGEEVNLRWVE